MTHWARKLGLALVGLLVIALLAYAFMPKPVEADIAPVTRGPLMITVDREGKTRVRERYVVSAPLAGRLQRITLHTGDKVYAGKTTLAVIEPGDPALIDDRELAEIEARVKAAEQRHELALTDLDQARSEFERAKKLIKNQTIPQEEYERIQHQLRAAQFAVTIAEFELELAKAALVRSQPRSLGETENWRFDIRSPITGCVLDVMLEDAKTVSPGTELLKLGDPTDLECVIDVLSTDGVKIRQALKTLPEVKVILEHWGGEEPLHGRVRLVEPAAFTKVSALGVEEQRVNVIVDFTDPPERWDSLGDSYRVEARIIIWEGDNVLKVPAGSLFRHEDGWAVFRVTDGKALIHPVRIGKSNGEETEILEGLDEGDKVVLYPSDRIKDGIAVQPREGDQ